MIQFESVGPVESTECRLQLGDQSLIPGEGFEPCKCGVLYGSPVIQMGTDSKCLESCPN